MPVSLEFLLGLLERDAPAHVSQEDFEGEHGQALRLWQRLGFLGREPGINPVASCPHCEEGVPYRLGKRYVCDHCRSTVDRRHLLLWRFSLGAFLRWLAAQWTLRGGVRQIDDGLWQLGTWESQGTVYECFYRRRGPLSAAGHGKLAVYRSAVVFYGLSRPPEAEHGHVTLVSLLEVLRLGNALTVRDRTHLLHNCGDVRFDPQSGTVKVGDVWHGEVPASSKEYFLLLCLSEHLDQFVAYADLKHFVLRHTGGKDTTEEATFCHRLKNRIKKKGWVPAIDLLLATTNKGAGYRLRGHVGELGAP